MRAGRGSLFTRQAAAHRVQFEAAVLGRLDGAANTLADERRHFDATLLDIENDRALGRLGLRGRTFLLRCGPPWRTRNGLFLPESSWYNCYLGGRRLRLWGQRSGIGRSAVGYVECGPQTIRRAFVEIGIP